MFIILLSFLIVLDGFELHFGHVVLLRIELLLHHSSESAERRACFESCAMDFFYCSPLSWQITVVSTGPFLLYYVINLRDEVLFATEILSAVRLLLVALHVLGPVDTRLLLG